MNSTLHDPLSGYPERAPPVRPKLSAKGKEMIVPIKDPPHPGKVVRVSCLELLALSVTEAAGVLSVTRQTLSNLINGTAGICPEMAIRLSKAFGSTPETWVRLQAAYDLAAGLKRQSGIRVERYRARPAA